MFDSNDLAHVLRLGYKPIGYRVCPVDARTGKINPHATEFLLESGLVVGVFHVKPIYYESVYGGWRPMREISHSHGNRDILLNARWPHATRRFREWLERRQALLGGSLLYPTPFGQPLLRPELSVGLSTLAVYPDPDPETTTVDGRVQWFAGSGVWSTAHGATDGTSADSSVSSTYLQCYHRSGSNLGIDRAFTLFDTSAITSGATISAGVLSLYTDDKGNAEADGKDYFSVVSATPATNTNLVVGDFDQCGDAVTNPTKGSGDVDVDTITTNQYFDLTLNATGLGWVSKTGVTKLGIREGHDIENEDPNAGGDGVYVHWFCAEYTGTTRDPKLTVTYSIPTADAIMFGHFA